MKNNILAGTATQMPQPAPTEAAEVRTSAANAADEVATSTAAATKSKCAAMTSVPIPQGAMNVIQRAFGIEKGWENWMRENLGYERKTTFMSDFLIGEIMEGEKGVRDTFRRAFAEWKTSKVYLTEMYMVLTYRCSMTYEKNEKLSAVYSELSDKIYDWVYASDKNGKPKNVDQEFVDYFFQTTD